MGSISPVPPTNPVILYIMKEIPAERKEGKSRVAASDSYKTEMVSPICRYEDIETIQELVRKLREAGALANSSCGIHVHIDASSFDARTLRNITNIMAAKEDLIYKALQVSVARQNRWCKPRTALRLLQSRGMQKRQISCAANTRKPWTMTSTPQTLFPPFSNW